MTGRASRPTGTSVTTDGGASAIPDTAFLAPLMDGGAVLDDWHLSEESLGDFISYVASSQLPDPVDTSSHL